MTKKVTHFCCQAFSDWSYASFCTLTSSILHNFHKILETDSNPTLKCKKSEKLYNADQGTKSHTVVMQCKWGFAIQVSQHKIFYAKKVTHLCWHASSHWSYASFCTISSFILHDFYGILETDSNLMRKYKKSEKLYNADWGIKDHMQCKWGFAIQMSQNKIFSCNYAKKVTHLCCQALSVWSYASFCTFTSSILHNFYRILETDSNPMQKYKIWKAIQWGSRHKKSFVLQNLICTAYESK